MSESSYARYGREYVPGDVLFREGESGDVMFAIALLGMPRARGGES